MKPAAAPEGAKGLDGGRTVPRHVAIIMDGNGRWAQQRGLPRVGGHRAGAEAVRRALQAAADRGVGVLTIYAFSSGNWRGSAEGISGLTALRRFFLGRGVKTLEKERVRLKLIGDYSAFGPELVQKLEKAVERTADNTRLTLVIALNYGSRAEVAAAARSLAARAATGELDPNTIDEQSIAGELQTRDLPELDLLVRTSGEVRLSNFLLWQAAYAELLFLDVLWPDFDEKTFAEALDRFAQRQRRFGGR